jgi:prepilin-type N-terminal cleavage/methylation domain-containing protein
MNEMPQLSFMQRRAFTLIELLVVVAIIGILAALILNLGPLAAQKRVTTRAQALLAEVETAIETYKTEKGYYPPAGKSSGMPQLYYELKGTSRNEEGTAFTAPSGGPVFGAVDIDLEFGVGGFVNSLVDERGKDFYPNLNASHLATKSGGDFQYIVMPARGPNGNEDFNPVHYVAFSPSQNANRNPVHNANTYDLWIEVLVGGKTNIIGNWE